MKTYILGINNPAQMRQSGISAWPSSLAALAFLTLLMGVLTQVGCVGATTAKSTSPTRTASSTSSNPVSAAAPSITAQPASQTVTAGQAATFSVAAASTTPLSYQWMRNGVAITGAVLASYTTNATATSDTGTPYSVIVNSPNGTVTSAPALLTVTVGPVAPSISVQPVNVSIIAGQSATFIVAAGGTTPLSYLWQ